MALGGLASRAQVEAMAAGRSMVEGSATTWRRVTDGNPCGFCAMLASRGPVYGSRADALTVTGRGKAVAPPSAKRKAGAVAKGVKARGGRKLGEEYHERCGCSAEPFEGRFEDWQPTPEEQIYKDAYAAADWYDIGDGSDLPLPKKIDLLLHEPYDAPREMLERFLKDMDGDQYDLLRGKLWAVDGDTPADIAAKMEAWMKAHPVEAPKVQPRIDEPMAIWHDGRDYVVSDSGVQLKGGPERTYNRERGVYVDVPVDAGVAAAVREKAIARLIERDELRAIARKGRRTYVRFGKPPESGRSYNQLDNRHEEGVSVYAAWITKDGTVYIDGIDTYATVALGSTADIYEVSGKVLDVRGGDNEPLLDAISIIRKIPKKASWWVVK